MRRQLPVVDLSTSHLLLFMVNSGLIFSYSKLSCYFCLFFACLHNFYSPSPKYVENCKIFLLQKLMKAPNLSLECRFPSLISYPSYCSLLCCLYVAVWTPLDVTSQDILNWECFWSTLCPIRRETCNNMSWTSPKVFQTGGRAPAPTEPVQVTSPKLCILESQLNAPLLL